MQDLKIQNFVETTSLQNPQNFVEDLFKNITDRNKNITIEEWNTFISQLLSLLKGLREAYNGFDVVSEDLSEISTAIDSKPTKQYVDDKILKIAVYTEDTLPKEPPSSYFLMKDDETSIFVNSTKVIHISKSGVSIDNADITGYTVRARDCICVGATYNNAIKLYKTDLEKLKDFSDVMQQTASHELALTKRDGELRSREVHSAATAGTIPVRRSNGTFSVGNPGRDDEAVNKKYLYDSLKSKADIVEKDGVVYLKVGETEISEEQLKEAFKPKNVLTLAIQEYPCDYGGEITIEYEEGMTWGEFILSQYNTFGIYTDMNHRLFLPPSGAYLIDLVAGDIFIDDIIEPSLYYFG